MTADLRASYDEVPYRSLPLRQTHPDHLATVASLFGFAATDIARCRVLEFGCAAGGNLIPMAVSYPNSEFVGIDFSPVQIRPGAADIEALALGNIRLLAMDVMEFDASLGAFDYISSRPYEPVGARRDDDRRRFDRHGFHASRGRVGISVG